MLMTRPQVLLRPSSTLTRPMNRQSITSLNRNLVILDSCAPTMSWRGSAEWLDTSFLDSSFGSLASGNRSNVSLKALPAVFGLALNQIKDDT